MSVPMRVPLVARLHLEGVGRGRASSHTVRTEASDHVLDIRSRTTSRSWKDEDKLMWAVEHGRFSLREADAIRRGTEAVARMNARARPFHDDWLEMKPEPEWRIPVLPGGRIALNEPTVRRPR
jgi:hypothetical protein